MRLIVATANGDKLKEIKRILRDLPLKIVSLKDLPERIVIKEKSKSFKDNAGRKALAVSKRFPDSFVIGEDSGLMVDVLDGRPGVRSARFAGKDADYLKNNRKLLRLLRRVPPKNRAARFVTVVCLAKGNKVQRIFTGTIRGQITSEPRGSGGFGYDPVFLVPVYNKTFAELPAKIKNQISHRAKALKKLQKYLQAYIAKSR